MKIEDIVFIAAMGPPGGGRSALTARFQRHFNFLVYTNLGRDSMSMIFEKILRAFIGRFSEDVGQSIEQIVESSQNLFENVSSTLKPTPSKSHYTFNMRDISKVIQGCCSADQKTT